MSFKYCTLLKNVIDEIQFAKILMLIKKKMNTK